MSHVIVRICRFGSSKKTPRIIQNSLNSSFDLKKSSELLDIFQVVMSWFHFYLEKISLRLFLMEKYFFGLLPISVTLTIYVYHLTWIYNPQLNIKQIGNAIKSIWCRTVLCFIFFWCPCSGHSLDSHRPWIFRQIQSNLWNFIEYCMAYHFERGLNSNCTPLSNLTLSVFFIFNGTCVSLFISNEKFNSK